VEYKIPYKTENRTDAPEWGRFALHGEIGRRIAFYNERGVMSAHAREEVFAEARSYFRDQQDDALRVGYWRGEFWGKLMLSAARVCRMTGNEEFRDFLRRETYALLDCQRPDGYLGTYRDSRNMIRCSLKAGMEDVGWACNYNWNVWCRKYTLWGLLEAADLLDDRHILDCADRMAEQLLDDLEALGVRLKDTGVMSGMPSCSILKPMLILYRLTGKGRYLDFARSAADEWEREDGECPNLLKKALDAVSPIRWFDRDRSPAAREVFSGGEGTDGDEWIAKAYEMMSCFDGICELYRVTGEEKYLRAAERYWEGLDRYERNVMGSVSYCERFWEAASHPDGATEICDVIHWMRLSWELYRITGRARYMDAFESAFVNAFFAGMYDTGDFCAFFIRSHGRHYDAVMQCKSRYQNCCLNNLPRGYVNGAQAAVTAGADGIRINLPLPLEAEIDSPAGRTKITVGEGYFTSGTVLVSAEREADAGEGRILFRIPSWSRSTAVTDEEGNLITGESGTFLALPLLPGRHTFTVRFDMTPRILDYEGPVEDLPGTDYHVQRWLGTKGTQSEVERDIMLTRPMSTVRRGPLILARSKRIGSSGEDMFSGETVWGRGMTASAEDVREEEGFLCRCRIVFRDPAGETIAYDMCDYASAGNFSSDDPRTFTLFV